jgi:ADP-ribose pyrophosphatase YjhB (NUDIX family)
MSFNWLDIAKRLEAIAQTGLAYTDNDYDKERYKELRSIGHFIFHHYTNVSFEKIDDLFSREEGYPTPKVDVRGVVFRGDKILMVREKLDGMWSLPGGWADIGYSPREVVAKEVEEESGLKVVPLKLLALMDKKFHNHPPSPIHVYKIFMQCKETGGRLHPGMETSGADFFSQQELPDLSTDRNTIEQLDLMFEMNNGTSVSPYFD